MAIIKTTLESFNYKRIIPTISLGVVLGAIDLPAVISFAILIYSGELAPFAGTGIGLILFGGLIIQLIIAITSSIPGILGGPQDSPAAILSLMAIAILAQMPDASPETKFITVTATIMLTSVVSGLFFLVIGGFRLGRFVRFIPYPVVGGFIAGTGFLLVQGAFGVMVGTYPTFLNLGLFLQSEYLIRWVPSLLFGIILVIGARRFPHFLTIPALLTITAILFYGIMFTSGMSFTEIQQGGWLLGPFPQGSLWKPVDLALFSRVNWTLIVNQTGNIAAVALISIVALLLNANALELIAKKDINVNRELMSTGFANILGGLAGSSVGYQYLGFSAIPFRMNIYSRLTPIIAAAVTGFVLLFGASLLTLIPVLMTGGVLFFLGITFLVEWLYDAWFQLPRIDYALVLIILVVVGGVGFLQGVGVGIIIAIILFVVNYSRIDIVKYQLTGKTYQSAKERPFEQRQLIRRAGEKIEILRLHGFVFFGTSQSLVKQITDRLKDKSREDLKFLIIDFQYVSALDTSAVFSFVRLKQMAETHQFHLVFTDLTSDKKHKLQRAGFNDKEEWVKFFINMDYGVEWCEDKLLITEGGSTIIRSGSLRSQLKKLLQSSKKVDKFFTYLERQDVKEYHIVINKGDRPDSMYFLDSGELTSRLEVSKGKFIRLKSQGGGTMVGEMGLFLKQSRTATVIADQPSVLYRLSLDSYNKMMRDDPELAFHLHQWIGRVLAVRLAENNNTLEVLLN
ncbi:MAG TPA: SulP family inorganic anion transporter [Anaerolineales bacterium]|nr:SulP family inorganic anion transporter [Anaerolineales bacterium]